MTNKKMALQFLCSVLLIITTAADTITSGRPLRDGETVVSAAGIYELGFFDGGDSASRFVGIWYKKISTRTIVWVANRNSPLNDTSGALMINENGNLVLVGGANNRTIWSSNSSRISENPVAWLSDGGNLVIKDEKGNFAWQSFDHPGNTLLPGMKLGRNLVNGLDWSISAWKTADDPSPGEYRASLDINGYPQLFVNKGSVLQYSSGPWDGMAFTGSPVLKPDTYFTFKLVITSDEVYYTYDVKNTSLPTRAVIIPTGVVQHLTWIERTQIWSVYLTAQLDNCDRYGLCGPYASCSINNSPPCDCLRGFQPKFPAQWNGADWSSGCERRAPLVCGEKDGFREFSGIKMPDSRHSWYDKNIDLKECKKRCLENCSCTAYSNLDVTDGSGCLLYFSELMDLRELSQNEQTLYVRVAASEVGKANSIPSSNSLFTYRSLICWFLKQNLCSFRSFRHHNHLNFLADHDTDADRNQKKRRLMRIIIGPTVIGTLLICVFCWCASKRRTKRGLVDDKDMELPLFDLATVSSATKNFSAKNMIGEGGFGPVYKGKLASGQEIAVKRLSKHSVQGVQELKAEVNLISKLQHRNLVKLLGCCIEGEEGILVYEFMPNNSLDHFIFGLLP
nr:G-type lectin S-receptor-like serine/threonine-protein kinase At4g27290 [Ipomoea batatas]